MTRMKKSACAAKTVRKSAPTTFENPPPGYGPSSHYMLNDKHEIIRTESFEQWAEWMHEQNDKNGRAVGQAVVEGYYISTVFLGIDHSFGGPDPILFETMVFSDKGKNAEELCWRYPTWDNAVEGHKKVMDWLLQKVNSPTKKVDWAEICRTKSSIGLKPLSQLPGSRNTKQHLTARTAGIRPSISIIRNELGIAIGQAADGSLRLRTSQILKGMAPLTITTQSQRKTHRRL